MAALAGAGVGGAGGGIIGALIGMGIRNMKQNDTKAGSRAGVSFFRFTAIIPSGQRKRKKYSKRPARRMLPQLASPLQIFPSPIALCLGLIGRSRRIAIPPKQE